MNGKTLAILVGGGPAPGINAVIAAATIEARNRGLRVLGCHDGYQWLMQGDLEHVEELHIPTLSRIHFEGGSVLRTSRANPTKSQQTLDKVADSLQKLGVSYRERAGQRLRREGLDELNEWTKAHANLPKSTGLIIDSGCIPHSSTR